MGSGKRVEKINFPFLSFSTRFYAVGLENPDDGSLPHGILSRALRYESFTPPSTLLPPFYHPHRHHLYSIYSNPALLAPSVLFHF